MKRIFLFFIGYGALFAILVGVIYLDRTTPIFNKTRALLGADTAMRNPIASTPTIMSVVDGYFSGAVEWNEAQDILFGARRWPDYRPVLPQPAAGWSREMPFRIDDSEISEIEVDALTQMINVATDGFAPVEGIPTEVVEAIRDAVDEIQGAIAAALQEDNSAGLGGLQYKASGAYYQSEGTSFLIAINKTWQSSFGAINDLGQDFAKIFAAFGERVYINGRSFRVTRMGDFIRLEHMVGTKARIQALGRAPLEVMVAHLSAMDLQAIYDFHELGRSTMAQRNKALPQVR